MKIKLHVLWQENIGFHVWGEDLHDTKNLKYIEANNTRHPYALEYQELLKNLVELTGGSVKFIKKGTLHLALPSENNIPTLSNMPFDVNKIDENIYRKKTWLVETCIIKADQAYAFLTNKVTLKHNPHKQKKQPAATFSDSFDYWHDILKYSFRLLVNESIIPGISDSNFILDRRIYSSTWSPSLFNYEAEQTTLLAHAMPGSCFAYFSNEPKTDQQLPSAQLLVTSFIQHMIQLFIAQAVTFKKLQYKLEMDTLSDRWIKKLVAVDPNLEDTSTVLKTFKTKIDKWQAATGYYNKYKKIPLQLLLSIVEPDDDNDAIDGKWRIDFCLRSLDNDPLTISAQEIWNEQSQDSLWNSIYFENVHYKLKNDLALVAKRFKEFQPIVDDPRPTHIYLNDQALINFLDKDSMNLKITMNLALRGPTWLLQRFNRLQVQLHIKKPQATQGFFEVSDIIDYDWKIALGNQLVSAQEFEQLAESKRRLIKIRDEWIDLDPGHIKKIITFLRNNSSKNMPVVQALKFTLGKKHHGVDGIQFADFSCDEWATKFLEKLNKPNQLPIITLPDSFQGTLRPYQLVGVSWLVFLETIGLGACLADDMGLGKTVQIIAWILYKKKNNTNMQHPIVLVCPMSILNNWLNEFTRFAPSLKIAIHHGTQRAKGDAFKEMIKDYDVIISTYAIIVRDYELFNFYSWQTLIIDEAQNIKNHETKQTRAIKNLQARYKIALTGTPMENRLVELWSIIDFLNTSYLGPQKYFIEKFARPIELNESPNTLKELKGLIAPCILRRLKTDRSIIKDLPEKVETKVFCNLTPEQATLYQAVVDNMLTKIETIEGMHRRGLIVSTLISLKQICNHPLNFLKNGKNVKASNSGKLARLQELIEELLAEGDKILIFTQFVEMGTLLVAFLKKLFNEPIIFLHGGVTKKNRDEMIEQFQQEGVGPKIFILSLKAGGVGLNLTQANHVFHFDRWWNPAVEDQATDRAFRIGQKRMVHVHKFVCLGTLEEKIDAMIDKKKKLSESIISSDEQWVTELSNNELKELITLDKNKINPE